MAENHVITADNMQIDDAVLLGITSGLPFTDKQRKLLAVVCLPQTSHMKVLDQCKMAGITNQYYYERINNPAFQEAMVKFSRSIYKSETPKFAVKYRNIALDGDRQALERLNEQNGVLDKKESIVEVNIQDSRRDIKGKTLHGLGAFDAEWEEVSDENTGNNNEGTLETIQGDDNGATDDNSPDNAIIERSGQDNGEDNDSKGPEGDVCIPDSQPDQSNQGEVSDESTTRGEKSGDDTPERRGVRHDDDKSLGSGDVPSVSGDLHPPDSHTTGQNGRFRGDTGDGESKEDADQDIDNGDTGCNERREE